MLHTHNSTSEKRSRNRITDEIRSFTDHYHKQQNGILQCIEISNASETRKEERFLTI